MLHEFDHGTCKDTQKRRLSRRWNFRIYQTLYSPSNFFSSGFMCFSLRKKSVVDPTLPKDVKTEFGNWLWTPQYHPSNASMRALWRMWNTPIWREELCLVEKFLRWLVLGVQAPTSSGVWKKYGRCKRSMLTFPKTNSNQKNTSKQGWKTFSFFL